VGAVLGYLSVRDVAGHSTGAQASVHRDGEAGWFSEDGVRS
jgi:hypothetical protein